MDAPGHTPHPHNNEQVTALGRAELTRGLLAATFSMRKLAFFGVSKGDDRGDMSQQGGQFQWIRLVTHLTHTTINK